MARHVARCPSATVSNLNTSWRAMRSANRAGTARSSIVLSMRSEDSSAFSQPTTDQHRRPSEILEEGGGLRRWGGLHG